MQYPDPEQKESIVSATVTPIRPSNVENDLAFIRAEVKKSKGVSEGTVIRFDRVRLRQVRPGGLPEGAAIPQGVTIEEITSTYAALYVGGKWYVTGTVSQIAEGQPYTSRVFFDEVLGDAAIRNVQIATAFESVEPQDESA